MSERPTPELEEGGICTVCGYGVRYGERHYKCGEAVMRIERQRDELAEALRKLSFAAQTTGGVAGRDEGLCAAIEVASTILARIDAVEKERPK